MNEAAGHAVKHLERSLPREEVDLARAGATRLLEMELEESRPRAIPLHVEVSVRSRNRERGTLRMVTNFDNFFPLGDPPDYEPTAEMSIGTRARRLGVTREFLRYHLGARQSGT